MKVGVVIPSRLAARPGGRVLEDFGPELWLDGALGSVEAQLGYSRLDWDIYVGLSPGTLCPPHVHDHAHVVWADRPGQAAAVNAAADVAQLSSDVLLFLEDDDRWHPRKFQVQLALLDAYPFASCSQRLLEVSGAPAGVNDYPVPSGWAMRADVWRMVRGLNENIRWMVDAEWLGRLSALKVRRAHLVERTDAGIYVVKLGKSLRKIGYVARSAEIVEGGLDLLVDRYLNPEGGMATIARDFVAGSEADAEVQLIRERFGCDPW